MEGDADLVLGEPRRVIPSDRLDGIVGVARIEVEEHSADPLEQTAAALQCLDRVGKTRRGGRTRDHGDFGDLLLHAAIEGRREVLGRMRSNGGMPNGKVQLSKNGFSVIPLSGTIPLGAIPLAVMLGAAFDWVQ